MYISLAGKWFVKHLHQEIGCRTSKKRNEDVDLENHYNDCGILFLNKASSRKNKIPPTAYQIVI